MVMRGFGPKKSNKQQRGAKRKEIPFFRLKANIQITSTKTVAEARVMLNDLSPAGVGCFVNTAIDKGEKVALVIENPKRIYLQGEVIWCSPYTLSTKILSTEQYKYRVGIKFNFETAEEQDIVKKFIEDVVTSKGG